jgi:hypothetical protein
MMDRRTFARAAASALAALLAVPRLLLGKPNTLTVTDVPDGWGVRVHGTTTVCEMVAPLTGTLWVSWTGPDAPDWKVRVEYGHGKNYNENRRAWPPFDEPAGFGPVSGAIPIGVRKGDPVKVTAPSAWQVSFCYGGPYCDHALPRYDVAD